MPILCRGCGAAVEPRADLSLRCGYCGKADQLPENEFGRALELRARVRLAAGAALQLDGVKAALAHVFEDRRVFIRLTAPWLLVGALVTLQQAAVAWPTISRAPAKMRFALVLYAAMGTLWLSGIVLSFVIALALGRWMYRRRVRSLLLGRSPRASGRPTRCRACGGDLPDERGPLVRCNYCATHNLVSPEVQRENQLLLLDEERLYRARGMQASAATVASAPPMTILLVVGFVVSYCSMLLLAWIASSRISTALP